MPALWSISVVVQFELNHYQYFQHFVQERSNLARSFLAYFRRVPR
jgi:hypothetical protein